MVGVKNENCWVCFNFFLEDWCTNCGVYTCNDCGAKGGIGKNWYCNRCIGQGRVLDPCLTNGGRYFVRQPYGWGIPFQFRFPYERISGGDIHKEGVGNLEWDR